MYDDKHRYKILSTFERHNPKVSQKGIKERLLCEDCEKFLNENYEKYANSALKNMKFEPIEKDINKVSGLDYKRFKLFLLSILWRAAVSSKIAFEGVTLGPHEEKIRKMIIDGFPDKYYKYGVSFIELLDDNKRNTQFIDSPEMMKHNSIRIFRFVFGGFMWFFTVGSHRLDELKESLMLKEDGTALVMRKNIFECGYIRNFAKNLKEMGRI